MIQTQATEGAHGFLRFLFFAKIVISQVSRTEGNNDFFRSNIIVHHPFTFLLSGVSCLHLK